MNKRETWVLTNCRFAMEANEGLSNLLTPKGTHPGIGPEGGPRSASPDGISVLKSNNGSYRYLYLIGGQTVAAIQIVSKDGKIGHVANAFTAPQYRRQGLATKLMDRARQDFQALTYSDDRSDNGAAWLKSLGV